MFIETMPEKSEHQDTNADTQERFYPYADGTAEDSEAASQEELRTSQEIIEPGQVLDPEAFGESATAPPLEPLVAGRRLIIVPPLGEQARVTTEYESPPSGGSNGGDGGGDDGEPPDGPESADGDGENGDDEQGRNEQAEQEKGKIAAACALVKAFELEPELRGKHPTFRVTDTIRELDVIVTHDADAEETPEDETDCAEVGRISFSVMNPEKEVPAMNTEPDASPTGGMLVTPERPLTIQYISTALRALSPEPMVPPLLELVDEPSEPRVVEARFFTDDIERASSQHTVEIVQSQPCERRMGSGEPKNLVVVKVDDAEVPVPMIERGGRNAFTPVWFACTEAGIPVPPEMFVTADRKILHTDVEAGGAKTYGNEELVAIRETDTPSRLNPEIDPLFIDLIANHSDEVREKARLYMDRASAQGILFDFVDPFKVIVRKDGKWDVIALNLSQAWTEIDDDVLPYKNRLTLINFFTTIDELAERMTMSTKKL
ncbi:MAG TPA: hypothetical protein VLF60_04920 [Candidatus Saccharimonadales bacterium]|nr:hypothetical protein [Candidatus Saccharimonadales bacterium]